MNIHYPHTQGCDPNMMRARQGQLEQCYSVPVQNTFGPLNEWVGVAMDNERGFQDQMECDLAQNKRRRFNTGADPNSFSLLSIDDKLSNMYEKLNNLEQSNKAIENITQCLAQTNSKVDHMNIRMDNHEQFLQLLAYKSIDIEARSRRRNLLFHGLAENRNEDCSKIIREFLWDTMSIDTDDYYIDRVHRLGSLQKARHRRTDPNESIRRPIIVAFFESRNVETILESAYMLRGTRFSVTRDFPIEIANARRRLMPRFIKERQSRNNKVSIEYPARLVINGNTVCDELPDWYSVLQKDRCQMANSFRPTLVTGQICNDNSQGQGYCDNPVNHTQQNYPQPPPIPVTQTGSGGNGYSNVPVVSAATAGPNQSQPVRTRTYAQAVFSAPQQSTSAGRPVYSATGPAFSGAGNIPRYTSNGTGNQVSNTQQVASNATATITSGDRNGSLNSARITGITDKTVRDQPTYTQL